MKILQKTPQKKSPISKFSSCIKQSEVREKRGSIRFQISELSQAINIAKAIALGRKTVLLSKSQYLQESLLRKVQMLLRNGVFTAEADALELVIEDLKSK